MDMKECKQKRRINYRRMRNESKRAMDKAKKQYLKRIHEEIMEFKRTGSTDSMYMNTKELGWKENHGIQNICIEDAEGNIIVDKRQDLKIWENYITMLYNQTNQQENLEV